MVSALSLGLLRCKVHVYVLSPRSVLNSSLASSVPWEGLRQGQEVLVPSSVQEPRLGMLRSSDQPGNTAEARSPLLLCVYHEQGVKLAASSFFNPLHSEYSYIFVFPTANMSAEVVPPKQTVAGVSIHVPRSNPLCLVCFRAKTTDSSRCQEMLRGLVFRKRSKRSPSAPSAHQRNRETLKKINKNYGSGEEFAEDVEFALSFGFWHRYNSQKQDTIAKHLHGEKLQLLLFWPL